MQRPEFRINCILNAGNSTRINKSYQKRPKHDLTVTKINDDVIGSTLPDVNPVLFKMSISSQLIKISNPGLRHCALNYFFFQNIGCNDLFGHGCMAVYICIYIYIYIYIQPRQKRSLHPIFGKKKIFKAQCRKPGLDILISWEDILILNNS